MNIIARLAEDEVLIMGILNVTPDSFSDGGKFLNKKKAVNRALEMEEEGTDIVDIGGESTRPGADKVELESELDRTIPVIEAIREETDIPISIDTYKSKVAEQALRAGANIVNDISALRFDPGMKNLLSRTGAPVVLMHMQENPSTMQENPTYGDVVAEVKEFLEERRQEALEAGIEGDRIILDPGIGFGKTTEHNFELLRRLDELAQLGCPILLGTSRKSFLGAVLDLPVQQRLEGTIATNVVGILRGANILRVHDVAAVKRAAEVALLCRS